MIFHQEPTLQTKIFLALFFAGYTFFLVRKARKGSIDLFDLMILSSVGATPLLWVLFPQFFANVTDLLGVGFPFLVLFGALFFMAFFYLTYLVSLVHKLRKNEVTFAQEIGLLKQKIDAHIEESLRK